MYGMFTIGWGGVNVGQPGCTPSSRSICVDKKGPPREAAPTEGVWFAELEAEQNAHNRLVVDEVRLVVHVIELDATRGRISQAGLNASAETNAVAPSAAEPSRAERVALRADEHGRGTLRDTVGPGMVTA